MRTLHPRVVLAVPRGRIPILLARANEIHNAMVAAASTFSAPVPPMPTLAGFIQVVDGAQQAAVTRGKGLAATRDLRAVDLINALGSERGYVQTLVDAAPEQAAHLAGLAGMSIWSPPSRVKPLLGLTLVQPPGTVVAQANAGLLKQGRAKDKVTLYNWRYTADGGKTYVNAPSTPLARATLSGLTALATYGVQVCATDADGTTAWSQTVSILVH
jgi:hypothetical protein